MEDAQALAMWHQLCYLEDSLYEMVRTLNERPQEFDHNELIDALDRLAQKPAGDS